MTDRPAPVEAVRALLADRFPDAVGAWVAGSAVTGGGTATSDLDVTVVLPDSAGVDVHRESLTHAGWPVELFVHTEASVRHFVAQDLARRRPTMARLVAGGIPVVVGCADLVEHCRSVLVAGPGPLAGEALALARYTLTDLLDDLADRGGSPSPELTAVAAATWQATAELALGSASRWSGTGKWLVRELTALDAATGDDLTDRLDDALREAVGGVVVPLVGAADAVLDRVGGRLWAGFSASARLGSPT